MQAGTLIAGKYLLERVIGQGGMGVVVRALHLQLQQPVAIKFLLPEAAQHAETVHRFLREARAAVRLRGEHIARVLDVGALDTGMPYMVLEYLEGIDLERFPRDQLTVGRLVDLLLQACEALAEAHALGIVHRDIKPANFFVTTDPGGAPCLKLLDFGISKVDGSTGKLTTSQVVLGTPAYMSPEQVRSSSKADPRSDIWSLGVVLYQLIEGALPFEGDGLSGTILQIVNDPPPRLTARLPAGLDDVIHRCLAKDPARRFQSTGELAAALAPYAGSPAQAAITIERTRGLAPRRAASIVDDTDPAAPRAVPIATGRRRRRSLAVAAGVLVVAGAIVLAALRGDTTAAPPRGPSVERPAPAAPPAHAAPPVGGASAGPATAIVPPVDDAIGHAARPATADSASAGAAGVAPGAPTAGSASAGRGSEAPDPARDDGAARPVAADPSPADPGRRTPRPRPKPQRPDVRRDPPIADPPPRFDRGD